MDFVDVDFRKCAEYVKGDLGRRPGNPLLCRSYEEAFAEVPESQHDELIEKLDAAGGGLDRLVVEVKNQRNEGSCVGNAGTQGVQVVQAAQFGKQNVTPLSAVSLYQLIGSSPNSGAMIDDCLEALMKRGAIPLDTPANRERFGDVVMPATGFYTKRPTQWEAVAAQFKVVEFLVVKTTNALFSALFNGHPVIVGRSGHSILHLRPMKRNGKKGVGYVNSWGNWGFGLGDFDYGFGFDSMSYVNASADWAFAIRSIVTPSWRLPG